jgi:hypothetical protein
MHQHLKSPERPPQKSFDMRFNKLLRCMELHIIDGDGMYPLMVIDPKVSKLYHIVRTKRGKLRMSAF